MSLCLALRLGLGWGRGGEYVPTFSERTLYVDPDTQTDIEYDASSMVETITITAGDLPLIVEDLRVES